MQDLGNPATDGVAYHGLPHARPNRNACLGAMLSVGTQAVQKKGRTGMELATPAKGGKAGPPQAGETPHQTVRRWRPFLRRRASTRRPFLLRIRSRNPCTRFRRRLWG